MLTSAPAIGSLFPTGWHHRQLQEDVPDMSATVIAERFGWAGSITSFREHVRRLRPESGRR